MNERTAEATIKLEAIPAEMRERPQWVLWKRERRKGKLTKVPKQTGGGFAKSDDAATWATYEAVCAAHARGGYDGIGYMFAEDDPFCGVDFDACHDPETGALTDWAGGWVDAIDSYTEVSPSGYGVKMVVRAKLRPKPKGRPGSWNVHKLKDVPTYGTKDPEIAMYDRTRFWCMTGQVYGGRAAIEERQGDIEAIHEQLFEMGESPKPKDLDSMVAECAAPSGDRSKADYNLCCEAQRRGWTKEDVWRKVQGVGKFAERGRDYFELTWGNADVEAAGERSRWNGKAKTSDKPEVVLPGGSVTVTEAAAGLGRLLAATGQHFIRGGVAVTLEADDTEANVLKPIKAVSLPAEFESVAVLRKLKQVKGEWKKVSATCPKSTADVILAARPFLRELPPIVVLSPCPVLVEQDGRLVTVTGYDRASRVLAADLDVPNVPISDARKLLDQLLADFRFATHSDRSRALAALITPALVLGGLLGRRAPLDLGEADDSQAGKGYRNRLTAAIYGQAVRAVAQRKGGVGSLEETFNSILVSGAGFISLDNVRGKIDSPAIESFLTEDHYSARVPYAPSMDIDPRRVVVMLTSNRAELTGDFANRCSCTRILKQPAGFEYATYDEGDILDHVAARRGRFLGAVFAVVRAWYDAGKPQTTTTGHDFRRWARVLDWIVQNVLGGEPLLDGHRETQQRMSTPALSWLRDVCLVVDRAGKMCDWLRANSIWDLIKDETDIETPGVADVERPDSDDGRLKVFRCIGMQMKKCFRQAEAVTIDNFEVARLEQSDEGGRMKKSYYFRRLDQPQNEVQNDAPQL